jgi:uncharacterized phage protein (TIGR02218 family)
VYRYTSGDYPIKVGANTYTTGLTITRGAIEVSAGLAVPSLDLSVSPQADSPGGAPTADALAFMSAIRTGHLDGCYVDMEKIFLDDWTDTSPGAVPWFSGRVNEIKAGRLSASIIAHAHTELLNVAMPRNIYQVGCLHTLFDAGCALSAASFQVSGTVTATSAGGQSFYTNLTQADGYFDLGTIEFTSGVHDGERYTIKQFKNSGGQIQLVYPALGGIANGVTFIARPGCDKKQATCSAKFSNLAHFRGYPYIPVPETVYAGGAVAGTASTKAGQTGATTGSASGGAAKKGTYVR